MQSRRTYLIAVAATLVAAIAPFGAGAFLTLDAIATLAFANARVASFQVFTFGPTISEDVLVDAVALAVLAYPARLILAIATTQNARGQSVAPLGAIRRSLGRLIRTRGVSLMVATFTFGIVAGIAFRSAGTLASPLAADVCRTLAAIVVTAGFGMASLADRAAVLDVDGTQDARASKLRSEGRFAGPHYLDTTTAKRGYDIATSADEATTVGMRAFLSPWAWGAALVAMVADAVPVLVVFVASIVSASGGADPRSPALWIGLLIARALLEVGVAWIWSRVYITRAVARV